MTEVYSDQQNIHERAENTAAVAAIDGNDHNTSQTNPKRLRCAIYTRKSSEEGLEQDFNSLDAQREACEAYVASQSGLGWKAITKHYDDGGISGGTMNRPALQELLADIRNDLVDVVVVYKIDRLTRSLTDFSKMMEVFDNPRGDESRRGKIEQQSSVSFVSVTQQFNTTTSMGRLTLNVLLSFAQFEREVTGERIRDKIAASKKKGMWMGGKVPLGYKIEDRKLIIKAEEADTVRYLFSRYLELGSVAKLVEDAKCNDMSGRVVHQKNGLVKTTRPFGRGNLYHLLSNPIYIGKVTHKGQAYDGQHDAIISLETWHAVQAQLNQNAVNRKLGVNTKSRNLLTGLLFDETGNRLTPSHANKKGVRYSYYVSKRLNENESEPEHHHVTDSNGSGKAGSISSGTASRSPTNWRLPAKELDQTVLNILVAYLSDEGKLHTLPPIQATTIEHHQRITRLATKLISTLQTAKPIEQRKLLSKLLKRVELHQDKITIEVRCKALAEVLGENFSATSSEPRPKRYNTHAIEVPYQLKKRGVEAKLVIGQSELREPSPDHQLIKLIAKAHDFMEKLSNSTAPSIRELSEQEPQSASQIARMLKLAFLAPDIIESILAGMQPPELTAEKLRRLPELPILWNEQKQLLGFPG